jgi:Rod binding domain-containing protein
MTVAAIAGIGLSALDALTNMGSANKPTLNAGLAKAKATAQDFESVFLNSMFQQMTTSTGGEGPFGGNGATGVWRSFLTNEYANTFSKAGGVGIADHVYSALIAHQGGGGQS